MSLPETSPLSIVVALTTAINAHDVDAALVYFAENAVLHVPNQQPDMYTGKEQIRAWLQDDAEHNISVETDELQETGERVTGVASVANDDLRNLGIVQISGKLEVVIERGKIRSFTFAANPIS